ncbi:hypothetical protein Aduo_007802 [Ancylostoma duodenale]
MTATIQVSSTNRVDKGSIIGAEESTVPASAATEHSGESEAGSGTEGSAVAEDGSGTGDDPKEKGVATEGSAATKGGPTSGDEAATKGATNHKAIDDPEPRDAHSVAPGKAATEGARGHTDPAPWPSVAPANKADNPSKEKAKKGTATGRTITAFLMTSATAFLL